MTIYIHNKTGDLFRISKVEFAPKGGGPVYSAPAHQFFADFRAATEAELGPDWEMAKFVCGWDGLEGGQRCDSPPPVPEVYSGIHDPRQRWNGWRMPYLNRESLTRFLKSMPQWAAKWEGDTLTITYDDDEDNPTVDVIQPVTVEGVQYWPSSLGCCWDEFDDSLTFEQFQASGRDCDDLGAALSDSSLANRKGRLYCKGNLWIEDATDWPNDAPGYGQGHWYTLIGRSEYQSDDLAAIERRLHEFAKDEGYTV